MEISSNLFQWFVGLEMVNPHIFRREAIEKNRAYIIHTYLY